MTIRPVARAVALLATLLLAGCGAEPAGSADTAAAPPEPAQNASLGLMTSLPLYWPVDADFAQIASGEAMPPWGRTVMEQRFTLTPLDTLSAIAPLTSDGVETDPLDGLTRLAVIQPRGLSPADNVALDEWVREGGQLLLVLDPVLTGDYDLALGDPRRPTDSALIPPVVSRWGIEVSYDEAQPDAPRTTDMGSGEIPVLLAGEVGSSGPFCAEGTPKPIIKCTIGKGTVTLLADAAVFEHRELAGEGGAAILALMRFAFGDSQAR